MKHTLLFTTIASILALGTAHASSVVTSKAYVDAMDDTKVDIAQGTGDNNANVGKTLVVNSSGNLELGTPAAGNYVEDSITDGVTTKAPSEDAVHDALEDKQDTIDTAEVDMNGFDLPALVSYDTTNGLVGNRIGILDHETVADDEGDLSVYDDLTYPDGEMDNYVPTVRTVANGLRSIWDSLSNYATPITWNSNDATAVNNYSTSFTGTGNWPSGHKDQYVTGKSLAQGLALKQNRQIGAAPVGNANSTDAGKVLVVGNDGKIAMGTTTVSNFQTKIPATEWQDVDHAPIPGVVISTDVDGAVEQRMILDKTENIQDGSIANLVNNGYDSMSEGGIAFDIHDNSVTDDDVNAAVPTTTMTVAIAKSAANQATSNKQNKIPARATKIESTDSTYAQSVVTNGTTDGSVGQMAILTGYRVADDGSDGNEFADYTNADNLIPTAAAVGAELSYKQARKVCAGWLDGTTVADATHTRENCVLWNLPD